MNKARVMIWFVVMMLLTSCQTKESTAQQLDKQLQLIVNNKKAALSSNPNDYINENPDAYRSIVNQGSKGLAYLTGELKKSKHNGLKEWIMAKACTDILQDQNPVQQWSTGKEWLAAYEKSVK